MINQTQEANEEFNTIKKVAQKQPLNIRISLAKNELMSSIISIQNVYGLPNYLMQMVIEYAKNVMHDGEERDLANNMMTEDLELERKKEEG